MMIRPTTTDNNTLADLNINVLTFLTFVRHKPDTLFQNQEKSN